MVRENGEELEIIEEEPYDGETEVKTIEVGTMENLNIELSINSVVGFNQPRDYEGKGKSKK